MLPLQPSAAGAAAAADGDVNQSACISVAASSMRTADDSTGPVVVMVLLLLLPVGPVTAGLSCDKTAALSARWCADLPYSPVTLPTAAPAAEDE